MDENERKQNGEEVDWSNMCVDTMQLILERLSFPDFHRARSVCSSWYSISKSCVGGSRYRYPWLIIFPESFTDSESCKLFDPVEEKTCKTENLGIDLSESSCLASYGNWLLMLNRNLDFSIVNVFSGERINLPPLSLGGNVRFQRENNGGGVLLLVHDPEDSEPIFHMNIETGMLWIDEKTRDFVVSWIYSSRYLFTFKKGDDSWWYMEGITCVSMAYKNRKLYVHNWLDQIIILDLSGDFPRELVGEENPYLKHQFWRVAQQPSGYIWEKRISVTDSGDVVIVVLSLKESPVDQDQEKLSCCVFKMNRKSKEWARVDSIGDNEVLVFGDGLTLAASGEEKSDLIYFVVDDVWPTHTDTVFQSSACVFNLKTAELTWSRFPYCASKHRWFVPGSDQRRSTSTHNTS